MGVSTKRSHRKTQSHTHTQCKDRQTDTHTHSAKTDRHTHTQCKDRHTHSAKTDTHTHSAKTDTHTQCKDRQTHTHSAKTDRQTDTHTTFKCGRYFSSQKEHSTQKQESSRAGYVAAWDKHSHLDPIEVFLLLWRGFSCRAGLTHESIISPWKCGCPRVVQSPCLTSIFPYVNF